MQGHKEPRNPLVSIVITAYNRAATITETVESALAQDYQHIEIVISDNCSTDNTSVLMEKYLSDPRVRYSVNETNIGMIPNFKKATNELAKGEYIVYVSSDDYLTDSSFISDAVALINKYDDVIIIKGYETQLNTFTGQQTYTIDNNRFDKEFYTGDEMFWHFAKLPMGWGGIMIHLPTLIEENPFDSVFHSLDFEVNLSLFLKGNVAIVDKTVYLFRIHGGQMSGITDMAKNVENFNYLVKPYHRALAKGFDKKKLDAWRLKVLTRLALIYLYHYYSHDKALFNAFVKELVARQPGVYAKAKRDTHYLIFKAILATKPVSYPLLRILFPAKYRFYKSLKTVA